MSRGNWAGRRLMNQRCICAALRDGPQLACGEPGCTGLMEPSLGIAEVCEVVREHGHLEHQLQRRCGVMVGSEPSHDRDEARHGAEFACRPGGASRPPEWFAGSAVERLGGFGQWPAAAALEGAGRRGQDVGCGVIQRGRVVAGLTAREMLGGVLRCGCCTAEGVGALVCAGSWPSRAWRGASDWVPSAAKLGEGQVGREATAAVPHGVAGCGVVVGEPDGVSSYFVRGDRAVTEPDENTGGPKPAEEVGFVNGCRRSGTYLTAKSIPRNLGASLAFGFVLLG
ncbi:hypothetical protein WEI85_07825 [Actinomycetes bacterium KLBMP 9797]